MTARWIIVPNWERFQHYGLARRPNWIKNYTALLRKDEYLDQPLAARGLLHGIWLAYADREGRVRETDLPATLLARARGAHLDSLNDAGLIAFSASKPLPLNLKEIEQCAEPEPPTADRRRQRAEAWITNGIAGYVPESHLAEVIAEDFHIEDAAIVGELVAMAKARRG